jgi:hypothetical protein
VFCSRTATDYHKLLWLGIAAIAIFTKSSQNPLSQNPLVPWVTAISAITENFTKLYKTLVYFVGCGMASLKKAVCQLLWE